MATATRRGGGSVLQVYIFKNGEFTGTDVFVEREVIIGRDATVADLLLESTSVSREHALLTINGNTLHIEDLGSTNGILLNEEEVSEADVTRFDEIGIGEFALKFKLVRKARSARGKADDSGVVFLDEDEDTASEDSAPRRRPVTDKARKGGARKRPARPPADAGGAPRREPTPSSRGLAKKRVKKAHAESGRPERSPVDQRRKKKRPPKAAAAKEQPAETPDTAAEAKPGKKQRGPFEFKEHTVLDAGASLRERMDSIDLGVPRQLDEPAPVQHDGDEDDDEDDDDENFVPAYSLVERLVEEDRLVAVERNAQAIEVLTLQEEDVVDVTLMRPGDTFWIGPRVGFLRRLTARDLKPRVRMLKLRRDGRCEVRFRKGTRGTVQRGQETVKLKGAERKNQRGVYSANLKSGEILDIEDAPIKYHVRYVIPPAAIVDEPRFDNLPAPIRPAVRVLAGLKPTPLGARSIGGSIGTHLVAFIVMALISVGQAQPAVSTADFVEVALDIEDLALEEPEPEPEPDAPEPKKKSKASEKVPPKMEAAPSKRRPKLGGTSKAAAGILGLLSKRGSSSAPGPAAAVAAVSNLSVARAPGGGGFRVSGLIGKLPTSSLSVGGGGGGPVTKGGLALLRGGAGGAGRLAGGKGTRKVGGLVTRQPKAMKQKGQGSLDRDEIQKVINKGISQIQRCYERELLRTPGLAGKIQVEWTVAMSGSVRSVRQSFSSMSSTAVVTCIMGKIKTWKFPRPRGGEVIVTYPFLFKPVGF